MKQIKVRLLVPTIFIGILVGYLFPSAVAAERCEEWVAKVVSVQGSVQARRVGKMQWVPVTLSDTYCLGDMIRVQERSRAAVVLPNEAILRLDQKTTITFSGLEKKQTSLLDLLTGAVHFFSRIPRSLRVITPFVNAAVEGTEFFIKVERDQTFLSIFEGRVEATNEIGSLSLASGESAVAPARQAPALRIVVRPRDAVQWALYYPPILEYRPVDFPGGAETDWQGMVRKSIEFYWEGDLARAFSSLGKAPDDISEPRFFTYRATLLLSVGRVDEAGADIERALNLDPSNSHAFSLQSIIAVVQNKKDRALDLAGKAVEMDPKSSAARVGLSYAQQARFDLQAGLASLKEAVKLDPKNALAWARLAELWLSVGYLDKALEAAQEAVAMNPNLARTQTVLGFAYLAQIKTRSSMGAFQKAIELDQTAPLPRLGLGLAKIREGDLDEGRGEIEIAVSLDPSNSLIRSYLGKAYYEEKRDELAEGQLAIAKDLDPLDPTPWFYSAIQKQSQNRSVAALQDLQKSIELNANRAVYRSRLLLDKDLAARSVSLARIYDDLGFEQLALVEGWKSVNADPANYSAHRFLADSYAALPRHEIARVSELLQSQLLQPINITPVQPHLAESNLFILEGAGPADPSFNEFNSLFNQDRLILQTSAIVGGNNTLGDEVVQSGVLGRMSYSIGQFYYKTDGFRENNDLEERIYNAFIQTSLSFKTSIQAEFRSKDTKEGDLPLRFDLEDFYKDLTEIEDSESMRLGLHHAFTPRSDIIASVIYETTDMGLEYAESKLDIEVDTDGYIAEAQHLYRSERFKLISGVGYCDGDYKDVTTQSIDIGPLPPISFTSEEEDDIRHSNLYLYSLTNYPKNVSWTLGVSADFFNSNLYGDRDQFNPKFGVSWNPFSRTTLRSAAFRTLQRVLISDQTIEPTQVAGFNQFFEDGYAAESWRYGFALDQKFSAALSGGMEFSRREIKVPYLDYSDFSSLTPKLLQSDWEENLARAYLCWALHLRLTATAEFQYEKLERDPKNPGEEMITNLKTCRLPLGINFFHPSGFSAKLQVTYIDQKGEFIESVYFFNETEKDSDQFWVVDASISYRLPKRWGCIKIEARNLLNEEFKFQDTDPANPTIYPEQLIFTSFTVEF